MSKSGGGRSGGGGGGGRSGGGGTGKTTDLSSHQSYTQPKSPQYQLNNSRDMSRSTTQQLNSTVTGATGTSSNSNNSEEEWKWGRRRADWGRWNGWDRGSIFAEEEEETTPMYVASGTSGTTGATSMSASTVPVPANSLVSTTNPVTNLPVVSNLSASQIASMQQTQDEVSALTMILAFSSLMCCFFLVAIALVAIFLYMRV